MINFKKEKSLPSTPQEGFALLYALLLTGAILVVGVILMNIITKQLIYSSLNRQSELAYYYAANSGRECLEYYATIEPDVFYQKTGRSNIEFNSEAHFNCLGQDVIMKKNNSSGSNIITYSLSNDGNNSSLIEVEGSKVDLSVTFNRECIVDGRSCRIARQSENLNSPKTLEEKNTVVMKATGYSGLASNDRSAKRVAISVNN